MPPVTPSSTFFGEDAEPRKGGPESTGAFMRISFFRPRAYRLGPAVFHGTRRAIAHRPVRCVSPVPADIHRLSAVLGRGRMTLRYGNERRTAKPAARPLARRGTAARETAEGGSEGLVGRRAPRRRARVRNRRRRRDLPRARAPRPHRRSRRAARAL